MQKLRHDITNHWFIGTLVCVACMSVMREGDAAPPMEPAEALFWEAAKLVELKQFAEACPKFAQSLALQRKAGTLFALGDCEDQRGKLATAVRWYGEYLAEVEKLPFEQNQRHADRVQMARDRVQLLAPRIPTLTFLVPVGVTKNPRSP